ncbi:MAG: cell division protein FtsQ/DivIB [Puniceicoccaceae bacterium]
MMRRKSPPPGPVRVRSWKSIQQKVPRSSGLVGRTRGRSLLVWAGAVCFSIAIIFLTYLLLFEPERILGGGQEFRIQEVAFETDGTLDEEWLADRLVLAEGATLLQTDIFRLRERLAAHPQVRECVVRRRFPETLEVRISEHKPVLRLLTRDASGSRITLFVAGDGSVFPGIGLEPAEVSRLPFLTGVTLVERPGGYAPVPGFHTVAELVDLARSGFPEVFRSWRIVDLSLYDPDPAAAFSTIRVRSTRVREALFATEGLSDQLMRLQDILTLTGERGIDRIERVDLRFDDSVPVLLDGEDPAG